MSLRNSITAKFILVLLVILVAGQGLGTFLYLQYNRSILTSALHERMQRTIRESAGITAEPILNYNFTLIDAYLEEVLKDRDIATMQFYDKEGKIIKEKGRSRKGAFKLAQPIVLMGETIGKVAIEYTTGTIDQSMRRSLLLIPLYQGTLLVVLALVLIRLFSVAVKRPLMEINRAIDRITAGDLLVQVPVLQEDEIGSIAKGVGFLSENLSGTIRKIDGISANVTRAAQQLQDIFNRVQTNVDHEHCLTNDVSLAVKEATDSQKQIVTATERLLSLSSDNVSALLEMRATSEEIAGNTVSLNSNLQNSYSTLSQLTQTARQIAAMSSDVSQAVGHASDSVSTVYKSVKEVETFVKESAELSQQTTALVSEQGMSAVIEAATRMNGVREFMTSLNGVIEKLNARSRDIATIIEVIVGVTEMTRLLSLNAQIIASQSGEAGKGFAVVANEMKALSDKTAGSTKEIERIVSDINGEIGEVVTGIAETVVMINDATTVVDKTSLVLTDILTASQRASEMAKNIEYASLDQTTGLEFVVGATEQIRKGILEVDRAAAEQMKSTEYLLQNISPIKDAMEMTRQATEEQAGSARLISTNIDFANQKTGEIATASGDQQRLNERIIESLAAMVGTANETVREVNEIAAFISGMRDEMESLRREVSIFNVRHDTPIEAVPAEEALPVPVPCQV
ncbi:HAMP domain-containing methyl-accepting chemotaxis protein [Geotalea sp. SG265]|uniref:methyl-accepting chemotaxis protein n=1 Tax=Geotalea sp. SG265 TaxID=2922867 RepID=UPI001FAF4789|nr:HAMP domain-containing methyl-accepting chemotaxis protein [Geotalea sp. SG265]